MDRQHSPSDALEGGDPPLVALPDDGGRRVRYRSETDPAPERLELANASTSAGDALARLRAGTYLLFRGSEASCRQLHGALSRRLRRHRRDRPDVPLRELFHRERAARHERHRVTSRFLVEVSGEHRLVLERAADVSGACDGAWGAADGTGFLVAFQDLLGAIGAQEWRRRGIPLPAVGGRIHPHHGVFSPTRPSYVELVAGAPDASELRVFDVGTGTGVLGLVQSRRGARGVVATDADPRAVACARENVERLGAAGVMSVELGDLFPDGRADRVLFNPPWVPGEPRTSLERGIFDPGGRLLERFLAGLREHLSPGGEGWLVLGDLSERLGLRAPGSVEELAAAHGLELKWSRSRPCGKSPPDGGGDRLAEARAAELVQLRCFVAR